MVRGAQMAPGINQVEIFVENLNEVGPPVAQWSFPSAGPATPVTKRVKKHPTHSLDYCKAMHQLHASAWWDTVMAAMSPYLHQNFLLKIKRCTTPLPQFIYSALPLA